MNTLEKIYQKIFDNNSKKINAKSVRESFALMDEKIDMISQNLQGYLKISDPKPTVAGKYELSEVGSYANLIPNIKPGETTATNTPITTKEGYLNTVYFDGTNWKLSETELPNNVVDNLNSTSTTDSLSSNMGRELDEKKIEKKYLFIDGEMLDNKCSDAFFGGGLVYMDSIGNYPHEKTNGKFIIGTDVNNSKIIKENINNPKMGKGVKFSSSIGFQRQSQNVGENVTIDYIFTYELPRFDQTFQDTKNYTFGFWINNENLNGSGLGINGVFGIPYIFSNAQLKTVGSKAYRWGVQTEGDYAGEILEVDGDYSYIKFNFNSAIESKIQIYVTSEDVYGVTEMQIFKPTLFFENVELNPYHYYPSKSEKNNSKLFGKTIVSVGDSQWQDRFAVIDIANETGANIISIAKGGHSIKYKENNIDYWFYRQEISDLIFNVQNVDIYLLPLSINDGNGGGDLSQTAIDLVLNSYPKFHDDSATKTAKLSIFNAMSETERVNIFGYKQTFSALISQLIYHNVNAKFVLTSIPISAGNLTGVADSEGNGIWAVGKNPENVRTERMQDFEQIASDSNSVAKWFSTIWLDTLNNVGLTFENFTKYCVDGTHWKDEIKHRIGHFISKNIL